MAPNPDPGLGLCSGAPQGVYCLLTLQYGFVIDQERCIGCHACTTACKAENAVPVGNFRTWVKYVDRGKYPEVKRSFLVQRCNHCTKPPCVDICPVNALSKREDGIVDIDRDACIGCRACMQACPYDALYLNEDLGAVEKCHFCAHRVEQGLAPACVNVCPVGAIIPGDFHDPNSQVSIIRKNQVVQARRTDQKTGPNVWYIGAERETLEPGAAERRESYLWSQKPQHKPEPWPLDAEDAPKQPAVESLNVEHRVEWGWQVSLYLVTKGIAGGTAMLAPFLGMWGLLGTVPWWFPESVSLVFTLITVFLLIEDLKKPAHFYKLFTRPNWKSWLVKGGIILTAFSGVTALILLLGYFEPAVGSPDLIAHWTERLRWINALLGAATAGYTAFLFKQCKGRDLWESNLQLPVLLAQSASCGAIALMAAAPGDSALFRALCLGLLAFFGLSLLELHHGATSNARQAIAFFSTIRFGGLSATWSALGLFLLGLLLANVGLATLASAALLFAIYLHEHAFVRAGQLPPLS